MAVSRLASILFSKAHTRLDAFSPKEPKSGINIIPKNSCEILYSSTMAFTPPTNLSLIKYKSIVTIIINPNTFLVSFLSPFLGNIFFSSNINKLLWVYKENISPNIYTHINTTPMIKLIF